MRMGLTHDTEKCPEAHIYNDDETIHCILKMTDDGSRFECYNADLPQIRFQSEKIGLANILTVELGKYDTCVNGNCDDNVELAESLILGQIVICLTKFRNILEPSKSLDIEDYTCGDIDHYAAHVCNWLRHNTNRVG
jgi:hypothetical protein